MSRSQISKQEWADWRSHPVTVEFFKQIEELREDNLQSLANGIFSEEPGKQSILIGKVNALTKILEVKHGETSL